MMKPTRVALAFLILATTALVGWRILLARKPEPTFGGRSVKAWVRSFGDGGMDIKPWGAAGPDAVPYLTKALERRNTPVEQLYLALWPHLPTVARKHLARPVNARDVRAEAAVVLGNWTALGKLALPALLRATKDQDRTVRQAAVAALVQLARAEPETQRRHPELVLGLAAALRDPDAGVRGNAVRGLAVSGETARPAVPALAAALLDSDATVRVLSARALIRIQPGPASRATAMPVILKSLSDPARSARWAATEALVEVQGEPAAIVPALAERLQQDPFNQVRIAAARALRQLGDSAQPALPALLTALTDPDSGVRNVAAAALKRINPEAAAKAGVR